MAFTFSYQKCALRLEKSFTYQGACNCNQLEKFIREGPSILLLKKALQLSKTVDSMGNVLDSKYICILLLVYFKLFLFYLLLTSFR